MYQLSIDDYLNDVREIPLTKGKCAIVSACDYDWLMKLKWHYSNEYAANGRGQTKMHRLILNAPADMQVDHINGNKLDNRRCNLRLCTKTDNNRNRSKQSNNHSPYKGITRTTEADRWQASIHVKGHRIYLGSYKIAEDAAHAYDAAARKYFGEFARTNF